jgi:FtsP/CotA-like multicopper oxidase with cupredoxin domain
MVSSRTVNRVARFVALMLVTGIGRPVTAEAAAALNLPIVEPNDNRRPAGTLDGRTLTLALRAGDGRWQPEGPSGPALEVEAFGEVGSALTVPAPLIRVVDGTTIVVSVRNDLKATLSIRGLCARDGSACPPLDVPPSGRREVRFASGRAGTYHYWASTLGAPVPFRELSGALIVDPADSVAAPDRILVITEWASLTRAQLGQVLGADDPTEVFMSLEPRLVFTINGLSWPATERLTYRLGEPVHWRVINLSSQAHPMHLHGFYFEVSSLGNGTRDVPIDQSHRRRVVTQLLPSGGTMTLTWTPEQEGNWLFHCHIMQHVSPARRLAHPHDRSGGGADSSRGHHRGADDSSGMAGMILGITVIGGAASHRPVGEADAPRTLTLTIHEDTGMDDRVPRAGFVLTERGAATPPDRVAAPGPPLVLRRGEAVEITLVNRLREPTSIHWHGLELESYYDGVHGWSGIGPLLAPMIEPGGTFVVRFTPRRAGTFIYHTHLHDYRQLSSGLYGPLIVTDREETFDPAIDHVVVLGRNGTTTEATSALQDPESVLMNGERRPRFVWKAGERHRLRVINIAPDDIYSISLQTADGLATWRPVAKDGVPLPAVESVLGPARQTIAVGETYMFEYEAPAGRRSLWLEVRTTAGKWQVQGSVIVK